MHILTFARLDSSLQFSCMKLVVTNGRIISIVRSSPGTRKGKSNEVSDSLSHHTD